MSVTFDCGRVLFRNGRVAMSLDCCCLYVPCCGSCYNPVSQSLQPWPNLGLANVGGPTQIVNFRFHIERASGEFGGGLVQVLPSVHLVDRKFVDECMTIARYSSACVWIVPTVNYDPDNMMGIPGSDITEIVIYMNGPGIAAFYRYLGVSIFYSPDVPPIVFSGSCSTGYSWDYEFSTPGGVFRMIGSFEVVGAKQWPAGMSCNEFGFLVDSRGRKITEGDLPAGFL